MTAIKYESHDDYPTPLYVARQLVSLLPIQRGSSVLEPHANVGNIITAIRLEFQGYELQIWANEYQQKYIQHLKRRRLCGVRHGDFLNLNTRKRWDWVIGNPPFTGNIGIIHVIKALSMAENVCFLLPLRYLASDTRLDFWQKHGARKIWVLANRPVFVGTTGGRTDYAWYWWDNSYSGPTTIETISVREECSMMTHTPS